MSAFRYAQATGPHWQSTAQQVLDQLGELPPEANLGFLYFSDSFSPAAKALLAWFQERTPVAHWVGAAGTGVIGSGEEYYEDRPAIVAMVGAFDEDHFRLVSGIKENTDGVSAELSDWSAGKDFHFGVLHGDPRNVHTPELIEAMGSAVPGGFFVGALCSSDHTFPQLADGIVSDGLSGVVFSQDVPVVTGMSQGCSPISGTFEVTEAQENVLISLDGRKPLDVMDEVIGPELAGDYNQAAAKVMIGMVVKGADKSDYLIRNLIGVDPNSRLMAVGDYLEKGQRIMFCLRDKDTAQDDLLRMVRDVKKRAGSTTPRGALYFSCLGRGRHMFGAPGREMALIQQELGDMPLAGFFANGEISHNRLYGFTAVLTLFL